MAASMDIDKPDLYVYAEFISLLKVTNICVSFVDTIALPTPSITRQIILGIDNLIINKDTIFKWPPSIRLQPNTCSQLTSTSHALTLRCHYEENGDFRQDLIQTEDVKLKPRRVFNQIVCRACGNDLTSTHQLKSPIVTRVAISSLGLPNGFPWDRMNLSYFCHDHDDDDDDHKQLTSTPPVFAPQITEYFDCETYIVFNDAILNRDRMSITNTTGKIICSRCHKHIGQSSNLIKLYSDAVGCSIDDHSCDELYILSEILKSTDIKYRRLCLVIDEEDLKFRSTVALLLVVMDRKLKTLIARLSCDETINATEFKTVWKLMYKVDDEKSDVVEQWCADPTVRTIKIHTGLLEKFGAALTRISRDLPTMWRYADNFCIAYIPHF